MRVAYKPKWQRAEARAAEERDKRLAAEAELTRLRGVLAREGEVIIQGFAEGDRAVHLKPLPYECVTALINSNMRYAEEDYLGDRVYSWRGRPLVRR